MKKAILLVLAVMVIAGCDQQNEKQAFDFAQKEIKSSVKSDAEINFKEMKLVRVVKFEDKTSKGIICGKVSNSGAYTGYKGFAIFYKTAFSPVSREIYYSVTDKVLPGQDYQTLNALCG